MWHFTPVYRIITGEIPWSSDQKQIDGWLWLWFYYYSEVVVKSLFLALDINFEFLLIGVNN